MFYSSLTEIIPVDPKTDFPFAAPSLSQNDIPTVAELFPPYATARAEKAVEIGKKSYGEQGKPYFCHMSVYFPEL